jgi:hypothetical protein
MARLTFNPRRFGVLGGKLNENGISNGRDWHQPWSTICAVEPTSRWRIPLPRNNAATQLSARDGHLTYPS